MGRRGDEKRAVRKGLCILGEYGSSTKPETNSEEFHWLDSSFLGVFRAALAGDLFRDGRKGYFWLAALS